MDANRPSTVLAGRTVSHVANPDPGTITVHFTDRSTLIVEHFMVSAPSAHEMIKTLERRGFITRDRDFYGQTLPRSIRVVVNLF